MLSGSHDDNSDDKNGCCNDGKGKLAYFLISSGQSLSGKVEELDIRVGQETCIH